MLKLDKEVISATATALGKVSADLPGMLSEADGLDVGDAVSGLRSAPNWAGDTQTDLLARVGLIRRMEEHKLKFDGLNLDPAMAAQIAGGKASVSTAMTDLKVASLLKHRKDGSVDDKWSWDAKHESFSQYLQRIEGKAIAEAANRPDLRPEIDAALSGLSDVQNLVKYGATSAAAFNQLITKGGTKFLTWAANKGLIDPVTGKLVNAGHTRLANMFDGAAQYFNTRQGVKTAWTRPGAFKFNLAQKLGVRGLDTARSFDEWFATQAAKTGRFVADGEAAKPTLFAKALQSRYGTGAKRWIQAALDTKAGGLIVNKGGAALDFVFGKPWTGLVNGQEVTFGRQAGNLLKVAGSDGVMTAAKTAGAFRVLGIAGGVFATADSAYGIVANWGDEKKAWSQGGTQGKAKVIGDFAEVGFNASLTAAMVAPNPFTLGAVAVTGIVYGGARLVEHWDDVTKGLGKAVDWGKKTVGGAVDWGKKKLDEVKNSKINPMNWF